MKEATLAFALILMIIPMFSQIRSAYASSSGYERYEDDKCEIYVEYFPIVPYDPDYPSASEEFPIKFYVFQDHWYEWGGLTHPVPGGFIIDVGFRDANTGDSDWPSWKRWYPISMEQYGTTVSWTLTGSFDPVPLTVSTTVEGRNLYGPPDTDYSEYEMVYGGESYVHMGSLAIYYDSNNLWGAATTEGAGCIGIPNDLAVNHDGHHIKILVRVHVYWINYAIWPYQEDYEVNFVLGDDIPSDTDCWLTVGPGDTSFSSEDPPSHPGGGDCPTLFVWNGTDYLSEGVLPIHAESDVTVQHAIQNTSLAPENSVYRLELRELDNYTSHLDQVKLYAVDDQGEWHLSPLLYANHSELGWVTWKLRFDDETRVDMTPAQTIALRFLPSIPYSQTAYFVFVTDGYNRKLLY